MAQAGELDTKDKDEAVAEFERKYGIKRPAAPAPVEMKKQKTMADMLRSDRAQRQADEYAK